MSTMKQRNSLTRNSSLKENNINAGNRRRLSKNSSELISEPLKLIPDFGIVALTKNISELLDLPERTDTLPSNSDNQCDIFSSNVIDVVKDIGSDLTKGAQDITKDISKTARNVIPIPLPGSALIHDSAAVKEKEKSTRNNSVSFRQLHLFEVLDKSREESFLDLEDDTDDILDNLDREKESSEEVNGFEMVVPLTPVKTYEQQDMFNLLYTPATCYSETSRFEDSTLDQSSFLNQSVVSSASKSVLSLVDSPIKAEDCEDEGNVEVEVEQQDSITNLQLIKPEAVDEVSSEVVSSDGSSCLDSAPDAMDLLLQALFDGDSSPYVDAFKHVVPSEVA